jgi:hypothetical protein
MQHVATIPVTKREPLINVSLTQDELTAFANFLDAGVKATGLQSVKHAATILMKLEEAVASANKPADKDTE